MDIFSSWMCNYSCQGGLFMSGEGSNWVLPSSKFDNIQCLLQVFRQCHCQISNFFFFSTIWAISLPQINCNNFFLSISVIPLLQIYSHNFFPTISVMPLTQTNCNKFFFLLFRQCHCHKSMTTFFF